MAVHQWAYGQPAGPDEGYAAARSLATRIAHDAVERALELLPSTPQEAVEFLATSHAIATERHYRKPHKG